MTREEFEQYAKENGLVVWSKEMSEKAIKALEQEPTTKNCESCRYYGLHHEVCNYCYKCSLWTVGEPTTKNDLGVDWESYKDADGNSLDDLILEVLQNNFDCGNTYGYKVADEIIELLPSVTPQEPKTGHCRDCKWWKDSDGAYRRGVGAESQCPINRKEVYEGNGYCYMFEPQESESKE